MFKSFQQLNSALAKVSKAKQAYNLERVINAGDKLIQTMSDLPNQYARSYSQIQWMKYDDKGNPSDVTPSEQDSAALATINSAKERINEILNSYDTSTSIHVEDTVPLMSASGVARSANGNYQTFSFNLVNGALRLKVKTQNYAVVNKILTNWLYYSIDTYVKNRRTNVQVDLFAGRIFEGIAIASDGKIIQWISYKISGSGSGKIGVDCLYNGNVYNFYFDDISHVDSVIAPSTSQPLGTFDYNIVNDTPISTIGIYLLWRSRNYSIGNEDNFIVLTQPSVNSVFSEMLSRPLLSGELSADLTVNVGSLYPGISDAISATQAL